MFVQRIIINFNINNINITHLIRFINILTTENKYCTNKSKIKFLIIFLTQFCQCQYQDKSLNNV